MMMTRLLVALAVVLLGPVVASADGLSPYGLFDKTIPCDGSPHAAGYQFLDGQVHEIRQVILAADSGPGLASIALSFTSSARPTPWALYEQAGGVVQIPYAPDDIVLPVGEGVRYDYSCTGGGTRRLRAVLLQGYAY